MASWSDFLWISMAKDRERCGLRQVIGGQSLIGSLVASELMVAGGIDGII